ncbi:MULTISPECIES: response regulator [unclassified Chelatococcus]|uniref:response regulator n=1 Tax=unclassified Chelatococcus TaxID=2638111 RepID=UPI001BCB80AF|nr:MULTISPECIES: response regulator [unclassified Chelatococcus]MBS7698044.1 response regulator [Chelatococcus sp. YT9]MBX3556638.1 response regulator [Chelatococcus sp.]
MGDDTPQHDAEALRILLVEDQPVVRLTTSDMLSDLGHIVEEAADAQSAIAIVETGAPIDVLITDIGLPDISGTTLAEECRRHLPALRVIFVSGDDTQLISDLEEDPRRRFLGKPFLGEELQRLLTELAGRRPQ